jgi:hypothetical protein
MSISNGLVVKSSAPAELHCLQRPPRDTYQYAEYESMQARLRKIINTSMPG